MNPYLILILALLIGTFLLDALADRLNLGAHQPAPPPEFSDVLDPARYARSGEYLRESTRFDLLRRGILLAITLAFWLLGAFEWVDSFARLVGHGPIVSGLVFAATLTLGKTLLSLPFSFYDTFVIEEKFGFNRSTVGTFFGDVLKGGLLSMILGGAVFAGLIFFFERAGERAWLWSWAAVSAFQLLVTFVAPVVILPIFNKFKPIPEGPLRHAIETYVRAQDFEIQGVYSMDASKRSTKSNAFFTGFGRFRRLVLFDTLLEKHTLEELMGVLAHEIGHYQRRHIAKFLVLSLAGTGAVLFGASKLLNNPALFEAFRVERVSTYASLVFIGMLFGPILRLLGIATNVLSRKYEFEADDYSVRTYRRPEALVSALKKLSADNLSHLTPHKLKVILDYSHPPVLERIRALRRVGSAGGDLG
jgi:STE24 endopeptidase